MSEWKQICTISDIPRLGSRVVKTVKGNVAVFLNGDDEIFALHDKCPHKGGPLSQGIVHGQRVTCPLHGWNIELGSGQAVAPDVGHAACMTVKVEEGKVYLKV